MRKSWLTGRVNTYLWIIDLSWFTVLDALKLIWCPFFRVPTNVIDALRRNFLWQGNCYTRKIHLVKWKSVWWYGNQEPKAQNHSLLMKWLWRFGSNEQSLWKKVISQKYEMDGEWTTKLVTTPYGVCLWRSIRNLGEEFTSAIIKWVMVWKHLSGKVNIQWSNFSRLSSAWINNKTPQ